MKITIDTTQLRAVGKALNFSDRRMRAVAASALTAGARDVDRAWQAQLQGRIDRPTASTQRAAVLVKATADTLQAEVKLRDQAPAGQRNAPQDWLEPLERGGQRRLKRFELVLQRAGAMPAGYRAVPGPAAQRDGYGNVSRSQFIAVLNQLGGTALTRGYRRVIGATAAKRTAVARRAGREYVAISRPQPGGLRMGIYERTAASRSASTIRATLRGLRAVFVFTRGATYRKQLALQDEGRQVAAAGLSGHAARYLREHIARVAAKRAGA